MPDRHPYLDGPYPRAYAHRGWHIGELAGCENTLAAFTRAVDEGFGYLELDVHATADDVAVVHHDTTLDRTTDGTGPIAALRASDLAAVRVAGRESVPTLAEVLTALPATRITVELKSDQAVEPVLAVLDRLDAWHRVCLGSSADARLRTARRRAGPRLFTSLGTLSAVALRTRAWVDALPGPLAALPTPPFHGSLAQLPRRHGPLRVVEPSLLRTAHRAGVEVHVWTVQDPAEMTELLAMGVDGLMSDRPDLLRELLMARDRWPG
ncbi:MAG: glycerophosphodiester phosphodiesterase family protein [Pseudonocardia sp.]